MQATDTTSTVLIGNCPRLKTAQIMAKDWHGISYTELQNYCKVWYTPGDPSTEPKGHIDYLKGYLAALDIYYRSQ